MMLVVLLFLHLTGYDAIAYRLAGCQFITRSVPGPEGSEPVTVVKWVCK